MKNLFIWAKGVLPYLNLTNHHIRINGRKQVDQTRCEFLKKDYLHGFPAYCGFEVTHVEHGIFETRVRVRPDHHLTDQ
ncbi:MAG: hypothetical protein DRI57_12180 [Deltaproteobacteria bacterium]|nr:MAG: hypothetical protein DRI57_12180 [Deltaproteobacteria bacterium]